MLVLTVIISVVALVLCLAFVGSCVYFWFRRRRYTRERFAFSAYASCFSLTVGVIGTIAGSATPWEQFLRILHYVREGEILEGSLSPGVSALIVCCLFGMYVLAYVLFRGWVDLDGQTSQQTFEATKSGNDRSLHYEAVLELRRILARQPPFASFKPEPGRPQLPDLGKPVDQVPWRELSKTLIKMKRSAFEFEDWRSEHEFWLARHRDHGHNIAIKCCIEMPSRSELEDFVTYVDKMEVSPKELIIAVQKYVVDSKLTVGNHAIEIVSQQSLLDGLIDFSEYCQKIKERVEEDLLPESDLSLSQTYLSSRYSREGSKGDEADIEGAINHWLTDTSNKQLALLGEYGQGKSTAVLMLTYHLLEQGIEKLDKIPILMELRGKSPGTMTTGELLATWGHAYGIESRRLMALHDAGRLLLIFDAFDEMALVGNPVDRLRHFQTLWSFNHRNSKIILTGRPNLFLDNNELKAALGIKEGAGGRLTCEAWYLKKFNPEEISIALRNVAHRSSIMDVVNENSRLRDLASRPSLLHVLSVIWDEDLSERAFDLTPAEVMQLFVASSLQRQTEKARELVRREMEGEIHGELASSSNNAEPRNYMVLNASERRYFMLGIAVHMMKISETNQILISELREITNRLARACPASVSREADAMDSHPNISIYQRIEQSLDFLERLHDDVRTCGLLVKDVTDDAFHFGHKSFLEYLAADYAERSHARTGDEDISAIESVIHPSFLDVLRNNVVRSYFGELLIWRRAEGLASQFSSAEVASFLMDKIVRPRKPQRAIWSLSASALRPHRHLKTARGLRAFFYRGVIYANAAVVLIHLPISLHDSFHILKRWAKMYVSIGSGVMGLCGIACVILGTKAIAMSCLIMMPGVCVLLLVPTGRAWTSSSVLIKVWANVCKDQRCKVEDVYIALCGNSKSPEDFTDDPIGIFTPRRVDKETYEKDSDKFLKNVCQESTLSWNRSMAAWILGRRHSDLGGILFSGDADGKMPLRDPCDALKSRFMKKVEKNCDLDSEAVQQEIESLNEFLGWDVREGLVQGQRTEG